MGTVIDIRRDKGEKCCGDCASRHNDIWNEGYRKGFVDAVNKITTLVECGKFDCFQSVYGRLVSLCLESGLTDESVACMLCNSSIDFVKSVEMGSEDL